MNRAARTLNRGARTPSCRVETRLDADFPAPWIDYATAIWTKPHSQWTDLCAILLILTISTATAAIGAVHTRIFGHDVFLVFDAGWRVLNGQRPDVDFSPSMGPLLGLLAAAGLKLANNSANGIGITSALLGGLVGLWGYALVRRRMPATPAILASAVLALIAVAPFPLGFPPNSLSHAMVYNRYCYALLGLVVLECFRRGDPSMFGGVTSGVAAVALLFLKPSYCLVALAFALARPNSRRMIGVLAGIGAAGFAMMAYLRFDFAAVWNDLHMMSQARSAELSFWNLRWAFLKGLGDFLPLALLALVAGAARKSIQPLAASVLIFTAGALLLATNAQPAGYPLNALLAILLVEEGRVAMKDPAALLLLGAICYAPVFFSNAAGVSYALVESGRNPPESQVARFQAGPLTPLLLYDVADGTDADQRSNGRAYVTYVNDGLDLIHRFSGPADTIFTLDMANPFSYALLRRPARGGSPALAFNHTFNDRHKPSPEWLFGSADIVMAPKHPASSEADARALTRNYLASIKSEFSLCAESGWWELYRRSCVKAR